MSKLKLTGIAVLAGLLLPFSAYANEIDVNQEVDCVVVGGDGLPILGEFCYFALLPILDSVGQEEELDLPRADLFWLKDRRHAEEVIAALELTDQNAESLRAMADSNSTQALTFVSSSTDLEPIQSRLALLDDEQFINFAGFNRARDLLVFMPFEPTFPDAPDANDKRALVNVVTFLGTVTSLAEF